MRELGLDHRSFVWRGGTVLALRYQHRTSQDIDLFLSDPQWLSYLSPRLNDQTAMDIRDYSETAHTLRVMSPRFATSFEEASALMLNWLENCAPQNIPGISS